MAETGRILFKSVHETKDESSNIQFRRQLFFLKYFKKWSWTLLIIACLIQCAVFWSVENTFGVLCCIFAWKLATTLIINPYNLNRYTLSTFVIIGFCLTQYILPVIFILLEGKPLVYNLNFPVQVFIHSILALLV
ncbi:MAG TPA: hypothetical protein VGN64_18245, partial [Dyadobacter sp.]|nr:hypothetical protein [Dyadobacter sp.]